MQISIAKFQLLVYCILCSTINGDLISWCSKKQQRVCTSTCESEILAIMDAAQETKYIRDLLCEMNFGHYCDNATTIFNDNASSKASIENGGKFDKNRHYKNRLNYINRSVEDKEITIEWLSTDKMLEDSMTKALSSTKLKKFHDELGLLY